MDVTELLQKVKPFVLGWFETNAGGSGPFAPSPHELNGAHHTGALTSSQYPDALLIDGSRTLTGNLAVGAGKTIDGVDISAHVVDANAHHAQQHTLVGTDHTATGLSEGKVVRASGATTYAWAQLQHGDLGGVSADQHHAGFVGLTGDSGSAAPNASDVIMLDGGNGIITAASGNTVALAVATGTGLTFSSGLLVLNWSGTPNNVNLSASAAGSSYYAAHVDHRHQLDVSIVPTWSGLHTFNAGATIAAGQNLNLGADVALTRGGANVLNLASGDAFRSSTFVPGISGWAIDAGGTAEFANAFIRGELHSTVFVKDLIEARAGSEVIVKSAGVLTNDVAVPGSGTWSMTLNDPPGGGFLFENGDICTIKTEYSGGVAQIWFTVSGRVDNGNGTQSYTCTWQNGTRSITYPAGAPALDYGVSGDGGLLMTADLNNAPWLSVFTHAGSPWTTLTHHLRLGNLNGLADYSTDKYGIFIGDYSGDSWLAYDPTNGLRIRGNALIDGTVQATAFTNDLGALLFSLADGAFLLGPGCAITDTAWVSTRGEVATISGAFHQVDGRWPGTRALLIEPGTTNYLRNPVGANLSSCGASASALSTIADSGAVNGTAMRVTADSSAGNWYAYQYTDSLSLTAGDKWTFSVRLRASTPMAAVLRIYRNWTALPSGVNVILDQSWKVFSVTATVDSTTTDFLRVIVDPDVAANGQTVDIDWMQVEKLTFATSLCWGGAGVGYAWSGTAHASTSARTLTALTFTPQGLIDLANGSLSFWFQAPCDYNTSGLSATRGLFAWWNAWNTESFYISFNSTFTQVNVVSYTGGAAQMSMLGNLSSGTKSGDWVHVAVTFTTNNVNLYINGSFKANDNTYAAPAITNATAYLGHVTTQSCAALGEVAAFKRPLTAEEVATIYMRHRPLSDCGSTATPGIYILDGKFDLRSSMTGARVQIDATGISAYSALNKTISIETDGDFFAGSSLASPLNTTIAIFSNAQTYSGEAFGAGDVLIGCNLTSANLFFDLSANKLSMRAGTTETMTFLFNGDATLGEVAAGKFNMLWDASEGDLLLRQNTTAYFQVDGSASLLKFGSNVGAVATTAISIFGVDQTYNSEAFGAGDLLIGDNSAAKANVLWDKSTGKLLFRGGTTTQAYIDTDGAINAGAGVVELNSDGIQIVVTTDFANARAYKFLDGTTNVGGIESYRDTTGTDAHSVRVMSESVAGDYSYAGVRADAPDSLYSEVYLWALCGTHSVKLQLQSNEAATSYRALLSGGDFIVDGATKTTWLGGGLIIGLSGVGTAPKSKTIEIDDSSSAPAAPVNGGAFYSLSGEMWVQDTGGNKTQLSPHNFSLCGGPSEEMAWALYSERDGRAINVDMLRLARLVEKLSREKLVYIGEAKS